MFILWLSVILLIVYIFLPLTLFCIGNIYLWILYIVLFICFLPTLLFYLEIFIRGLPFAMGNVYEYGKLNNIITDILRRRFGFQIIGKKKYEKPVLFLLNHHEKGAILEQLATLYIQSSNDKSVIVNYNKIGVLTNVFKSIDHLSIDRNKVGRFDSFIMDCKKRLDMGHNIIIYPEGRYQKLKKHWRKMVKFQSGAFHLACNENINIVPIIISGSSHINGIYVSKPIVIKYLEPIETNGWNADDLKEYVINKMNYELKYIN